MEEREKKVSIIIPHYNRGYLIQETLDSIKRQEYTNWECIIVDDHSIDDSFEVIAAYIHKDPRFRIVQRPPNKPKGANSCRNHGFQLSNGFYIQWFDSDDIMLPEHLNVLIKTLENEKVDFAVGDAVNFEGEGIVVGKPYEFDRQKAVMSGLDYGKQTIGWITDDFLGKREILEDLRFNENINTDGDEYNFFTRLLHENNNGIFLDRVLTYRRIHDKSLTSNSSTNDQLRKISKIKYLTAQDIEKYENKELSCWFLSGFMQYSFKLALVKEQPPYISKSLLIISKHFGKRKALSYIFSLVMASKIGRGYLFLRWAIQY